MIVDTLKHHPSIGILSSGGAVAVPFIDFISPYLQFAALVVGLAIGFLTLAIKIREWRHGF